MKFNLLAIVIIFFEAMVHLNFCEVAEADIRRMKSQVKNGGCSGRLPISILRKSLPVFSIFTGNRTPFMFSSNFGRKNGSEGFLGYNLFSL